jgi:hypothetical protein
MRSVVVRELVAMNGLKWMRRKPLVSGSCSTSRAATVVSPSWRLC